VRIFHIDAAKYFAPSPSPETSNVEDDGTKRVVSALVNAVSATSVEEDGHNTSSKAKSAKLAKLVKLAKSTALWCLLPYVPLTQEAKDKQRKVCPVNLRGEVCTASNCSGKHSKVCLVANHGKGKIPKATCSLWDMQVPFTAKWQGNFTGRKKENAFYLASFYYNLHFFYCCSFHLYFCNVSTDEQ
jgi:hypothetical protein